MPAEVLAYPLKLAPRFVPRLWGGDSLAAFHGAGSATLAAAQDPAALRSDPPNPTPIGESWLLGDENIVINGPLASRAVAALAQEFGAALLGTANTERYGNKLALLAKFLDAEQDLSVQVHPDDTYALAHERESGHLGKAEAWYVLAAEPGSSVLWGFRHDVTAGQVAEAVREGELVSLLNRLPVAAGDVIVNPAGTVHAVGAGVMLFEIQQSSDLTYRLYDYDRRDASGRPRELHLDKSLAVADLKSSHPGQMLGREEARWSPDRWVRLVELPQFVMDAAQLSTGGQVDGTTTPLSLELVVLTRGEVVLTAGGAKPLTISRGEAALLPAALGSYRIEGSGEVIRCAIEKRLDD